MSPKNHKLSIPATTPIVITKATKSHPPDLESDCRVSLIVVTRPQPQSNCPDNDQYQAKVRRSPVHLSKGRFSTNVPQVASRIGREEVEDAKTRANMKLPRSILVWSTSQDSCFDSPGWRSKDCDVSLSTILGLNCALTDQDNVRSRGLFSLTVTDPRSRVVISMGQRSEDSLG